MTIGRPRCECGQHHPILHQVMFGLSMFIYVYLCFPCEIFTNHLAFLISPSHTGLWMMVTSPNSQGTSWNVNPKFEPWIWYEQKGIHELCFRGQGPFNPKNRIGRNTFFSQRILGNAISNSSESVLTGSFLDLKGCTHELETRAFIMFQ